MIDRETLRALIRDVVAAEVAAAKAQAVKAQAAKAQAAKAQAGQRGVPAERPAAATAVRIATDADLAAFARQVLALAGDPAVRAAIESGRHPFRLAGGAPSAHAPASRLPAAGHPSAAPRPAGPARITAGVVTEKTLVALPRGTSVLEVGPEVAVTPLARDKARSLKITIERIRP